MKPVADEHAAHLLRSLIRDFGEARFRARGTSMLPAINTEDILVIGRGDISSIAIGDVVLFEWEGRLLAHRVVSIAGSGSDPLLITRGDAHAHSDPPVDRSRLIGRVSRVVRGDRRATPAGWKRIIWNLREAVGIS